MRNLANEQRLVNVRIKANILKLEKEIRLIVATEDVNLTKIKHAFKTSFQVCDELEQLKKIVSVTPIMIDCEAVKRYQVPPVYQYNFDKNGELKKRSHVVCESEPDRQAVIKDLMETIKYFKQNYYQSINLGFSLLIYQSVLHDFQHILEKLKEYSAKYIRSRLIKQLRDASFYIVIQPTYNFNKTDWKKEILDMIADLDLAAQTPYALYSSSPFEIKLNQKVLSLLGSLEQYQRSSEDNNAK